MGHREGKDGGTRSFFANIFLLFLYFFAPLFLFFFFSFSFSFFILIFFFFIFHFLVIVVYYSQNAGVFVLGGTRVQLVYFF